MVLIKEKRRTMLARIIARKLNFSRERFFYLSAHVRNEFSHEVHQGDHLCAWLAGFPRRRWRRWSRCRRRCSGLGWVSIALSKTRWCEDEQNDCEQHNGRNRNR